MEIVSDLANQRKAVDDWISLTNRATHTVNQLTSFNKFKRSKSKELQTTSSVTNGIAIVDDSLNVDGNNFSDGTDSNQLNHDLEINLNHSQRKLSESSKRPILPNNE